MKTKVLFFVTLISIILISSCESPSSKKRRIATEKTELDQKILVNPAEETIIGVPMSVSYAIEPNFWNLSLDVKSENGYAYNIEIDSSMAMKIIQDKSIVAVKITGKSIDLLR